VRIALLAFRRRGLGISVLPLLLMVSESWMQH
jgi:hypothetical protein